MVVPHGNGDRVAMDADVLITIVFGGFVAFAALAVAAVLLRSRARAHAAEQEPAGRPLAPGR